VWTPDEIALAEEVADRVWTTLEFRKVEAELRANDERLAFLLRLNDALRPLSDPAAVQETAARLLAEHLGVSRVGYAELGEHDYVIRHEHTRGVAPLAGTAPGISTGDVVRDALRRGETVVVTDVETDSRLGEPERATFRTRHIAAFIAVARFNGPRMVAAFGANHVSPRLWSSSEIELVRDVAARTWDAVERTRAEAALREQDKRLRLALEASAGGAWSWVAEINQVDWDERFRALYGFTPDEPATTDGWLTRVHDDDRPRMIAAMQEIMSSTTKTSWENTFRIVRPDGSLVWVQSRGRADRDADGKIQRLTGLDLDFSRHRRLEEAERAERDQEHDRALRTLLETATQGIVSVDAQGVILTANRAFEDMFGWPSGELMGQTISRLLPQAFVDWPGFQGSRDLIGVRKDASTFPIEVTINHVPSPTGSRAFAFVTDITERERAAAALRARTIELEYQTRQLSQMASDLTLAEQNAREQIAKTLHDGLQQLLVISSSNLDRHVKRDQERGAATSELLSAARRHLDEAIVAARSLSIELFPPILHRSGLPSALQWLARWAQEKYRLEVHIKADPRADTARKDVRTLLFESVRELLLNVVKHAKAERVAIELTRDADDQLWITVTDQGVGFDPAQLDDRSKVGQSGWGLLSIRERLTLLGGRFDVESASGRGTQVRLCAPGGDVRAHEVAAQHAEIESARVLRAAATPADALRILVVDDHAPMRNMLRELLHERPQLSVVGDASNGLEAIASARMLRPDVIVMDVTMPHMDGIEATARIRAELPGIEILGVSMHARGDGGQAIEQAGAAKFFVKGTDTERLVDHLLRVHASRRAAGLPS
jgi:PAS domain S-box-containing protein